MIRTGQGLIDKKQCQGAEEVVSQRLTTIGDQWEYLVQKSTEKSMKLKEASKQQVMSAFGGRDIHFWLRYRQYAGDEYVCLYWK